MKFLKKIFAILLCISMILGLAGCELGDEYDNFNPIGVRVVESIGGTQFDTLIDDEKVTKELWREFENLVIDTEQRGEMGTSYIYMCFYDEDQSTLGIFTMYENGSCCLGEDFEKFYIVDDGEDIYLKLCDIYTKYESTKDDNESE